MKKSPLFASILFAGLSVAGIVAMFSQKDGSGGFMKAESSPRSSWKSLNPGETSRALGEFLPQVSEQGARLQLRRTDEEEKEESEHPRRLRLR